MKSHANNVFEVELDFMRVRCIRESIERLLCFSFAIFNNTDYLINTCLVDQTVRAINKQANVWVKFNFRRKLYCASLDDRPPAMDTHFRPNEAGAARPQRLPACVQRHTV